MRQRLLSTGFIIAALILSLVLTFVVFGLPVQESLGHLWAGAFRDKIAISRTLVAMTPLLLTGLGMVIAWRAGMYNIGGEGQFIFGGLFAATLFSVFPSLPPFLLTSLLVVASIIGGALYAGLAGWLQIKRGVQMVISTILLNFIAIQILDWACSGPLKDPSGGVPLSKRLPEAVMFTRFDRQTDLHSGVILALVVGVVIYVFLFLTKAGYLTRVVGENPRFARANRFPPDPIRLRATFISGGLCGLAGGVEYLALAGQLGRSFSQDWGFLGIPVALIGFLHPLGTIASAFYFGALFAGCNNLARQTSANSSISYVIQALAVLIVVALVEWQRRRELARVVPE